MAGKELTPKDNEFKKILSKNLTTFIRQHGYRQIDIVRELNIPASTLNGYIKGLTLPTPENVEKLANFFHVDKADIDPRFSTKKNTNITEDDLEKALDNAHSYDGNPIDDHDRQIIKGILTGYFKNKD